MPETSPNFPLNAKQVHYLVTQGYLPYSAVAVEKGVIREKNKGGGLVRLITVGQIPWFSLNSIARVVQGLDFTTMELSTMAYILCTVATCHIHYTRRLD